MNFPSPSPTFPLRVLEVNGQRYLHIEDVAALVRALGDGEKANVRQRLDEASDQLLQRIKDAQ